MSQTIDVLLTVSGEEDVLIFKIDEEHPEDYYIELNSDSNQMQLKELFSKLLEKLIDTDIELKLTVAEGYSKALYKDVCREYIDELNSEIVNVKSQIDEQLK